MDLPEREDGAIPRLTHLDADGRAAMVGVESKPETRRRAVARAIVQLSEVGARALREGALPKGSPAEVVRLAAIQGAKWTDKLVPLCHPVRVTRVEVELSELAGDRWSVEAAVTAVDRTGVEMEAMTAVSVGALTLYDMVKAVDRGARIVEVVLLEKDGGKSGHYQLEESRRTDSHPEEGSR